MLKLHPPSLVTTLLEAPEETIARISDIAILLVELDSLDGALAQNLLSSTSRKQSLPTPTFDTSSQTRTRIRVTPASSKTGDSQRRQRRRKPRAFTSAMLEKQLAGSPHFAVLVAKRHTMTLEPRVRVGRSKSSDIVLSHPTVSSKHAFLDSDAEDVYFVTDCGSTNGTSVNGEALAPQETVDAYPGDHIQFGDVDTTLCLLGTLRSVLVRSR